MFDIVGVLVNGVNVNCLICIICFECDWMGNLKVQYMLIEVICFECDKGDWMVKVECMLILVGIVFGIIFDVVSFEYDKVGCFMVEYGVNGIVEYVFDVFDNVIMLVLLYVQILQILWYGLGYVYQICCGDQVVSDFECDDLYCEVMCIQGWLIQCFVYDLFGWKVWQLVGF